MQLARRRADLTARRFWRHRQFGIAAMSIKDDVPNRNHEKFIDILFTALSFYIDK